jgi:hypothetical protein
MPATASARPNVTAVFSAKARMVGIPDIMAEAGNVSRHSCRVKETCLGQSLATLAMAGGRGPEALPTVKENGRQGREIR